MRRRPDAGKRNAGENKGGRKFTSTGRPEKKAFRKPKTDNGENAGKRSTPKSDSARKPFERKEGKTDRPSSTRKFISKRTDADDRPKRNFKRSSDGEYTPRNTRSTGRKPSGEDRPARNFKRSSDGEYTPRNTGSTGRKPGGEDRPARNFKRSSDGEYTPRNTRSTGRKPSGDDRPARNFKRSSDGEYTPRNTRSTGRKPTDGERPKRTVDQEGGERKPARTSRVTTRKSFGREDSKRPFNSDERKPRNTSFDRERTGRKPSNRFEKSYSKKGRKPDTRLEETPLAPDKTRLNKYIANAGICSRREADKLIGAGLVSVNGVTITEMGYQVKPGDVVKYNNSKLSTEKKVYVLMNKPKDTITTLDDPDGRNIVTDLLKGTDLPRVYPVGRLDRNTTGVLLLTNDGELAQRLMHPKYEVQKIYKATLFKNIKGEDLWTLQNGVELEDGFIKPDSIAVPDAKVKNEVGIEIHSGRNRIIHRMFEHVGYPLEKLDRVLYAGLTRRGLKRGQWRMLEDRELTALKKLVKLK